MYAVRSYYVQKKRERREIFNTALNSTLSRTFSTSLSTFFVLLAIFVFGGDVIRGFTFALLLGVIVGTSGSGKTTLIVITSYSIHYTKLYDRNLLI